MARTTIEDALRQAANPDHRKKLGQRVRQWPPPLSTTVRGVYSRNGCTVHGWPSSGGVIIRGDCDAVELKFLGWDPLSVPAEREEDQAKEDEFCAQLLRIGGKWWSSRERFYETKNWNSGSPEDLYPSDEEFTEVFIGWMEGGKGILVLEDLDVALPSCIGMLRLVATMEERCRLMREKMDAVYYEDFAMYPRLADLDAKIKEGRLRETPD